jgi:hypothetical protein
MLQVLHRTTSMRTIEFIFDFNLSTDHNESGKFHNNAPLELLLLSEFSCLLDNPCLNIMYRERLTFHLQIMRTLSNFWR